MSLFTAFLDGSTAALQLIQQYLVNPTINGIPIECETYKVIFESDISEQLIITTNLLNNDLSSNKQYMSDNIAPHPRMWTMSGYIAPTFIELSAISPILQPLLLLKIKQLQTYAQARVPVIFTSKNRQDTLYVAIKSMELNDDPSIMNAQPISIIVKELPVLNETILTGTVASPSDIGNIASPPVPLGAISALPLTVGLDPALGPLGI